MPQPSYSNAVGYISENFITLAFSVPLDGANPPQIGAFSLQLNGTGVTVTGVTVDSAAQTVTVAINSYLLAGDIVDFTYTDPSGANDVKAIQGQDGSDAASFSNSVVIAIGRPGPSAPPTPTLDAASDSGTIGDRISNDNTPTVRGTAEANATIKLYDSDGTTLLGSVAADGNGKWSITSSALADGDHALKVTQTDGNNAVSTFSTSLNVRIDTAAAAPTGLALKSGTDSGTPGDGITNVTQPKVAGLAEAGATVRLYDSDGLTMLGSTVADGGGKWEITSSILAQGTHGLTATQTDVAGNLSAASSTFSIAIDTSAPTAIALSATSAQTASATNGSTLATVSATDAGAVQYGFATGDGTTDRDNGKFTLSGNDLVAAQNLLAGSYNLYLKATDAAGNDAFRTFTFTVTDAPSVSAIARVGAATVPAADGSLAYTVTFDQAVTGVDKEDFLLTGSGSATGTIDAVTGSGTTYTVTVKDIAGDGTLRLDLAASGTGIQNAGGTPVAGGYTSGAAFTLDHTIPLAPGAPAANPADDSGMSSTDGISSVAAPRIGGTAEANAVVKLYDTDGTTLLGSASADSNGKWQITSAALGEGSHTLTAVQTDAAGNVSPASAGYAYVVDTTGPTGIALSRTTLPITQAGSGATVATLGATDAHAVAFALAPAPGGVADADNGKFSVADGGLVAAQGLEPGVYHVYVKATDAAGNAASKALTFEVIGAPKVASVVRAAAADPLAPATAASVTYTVTFDQSVTGVDAQSFSLTTSAGATGAIGAVTGSGNTYTVKVDNIAGDGTLRLDVQAGAAIRNADGTLLSGGYTDGQTFALDHTAPAVVAAFAIDAADDTGTSHADGVTSVAAPHVSGNGEAHATVRLYDTDGTTLLGETTANDAGDWTIASSTLADGKHTLTVRQADAAGNVSAAGTGLAVTIDTSAAAPGTPVLAPADDSGAPGDGITSVRTPTVRGKAEAFATVRLYDTDGSTLLGTGVADADGKWSIASTSLPDGLHVLTVKQTDVAGNVSPASPALQLTVDGTAPAAPAAPALDPASDTGTRGDGVTTIARPVLTGSAAAGAGITLYDTDGQTVVGTATADAGGHWSATVARLALGEHRLSATQTDAAGNVSPAGGALTLTIVAPPAPPATVIDGTPVTQQPVTLPGGQGGTLTTVPIVVADRAESNGSPGVADIPLSARDGANLLVAQVPAGFGLSATGGASQAGASAAEQLIQAIRGATPDHSSADQGHLTGNGQSFLDLLPATVPLLVQTVTPLTAAGASGATLTLTGTSGATQHTALVIDVSGVGAGNTVALKNVDFAAVIGAADVIGATAGQVITGDAAAQTVTVGAGQASSVFTGGGDDALRLGGAGAGTADGASRASADARGVATTLLHGGQGTDAAVFGGARAAYTIEEHDGHLLVRANDGGSDLAYVVNVETLRFADGDVAVQHRAAVSTIAGMYADVLGRQADVAGIEFWSGAQAAGATLGQVAMAMIGSAEGRAHQSAFSGDAAHDVGVLYQALFGRAADEGGAAFWLDAMQHGVTLHQVADAMLHSTEIVGHALAATQWDFLV